MVMIIIIHNRRAQQAETAMNMHGRRAQRAETVMNIHNRRVQRVKTVMNIFDRRARRAEHAEHFRGYSSLPKIAGSVRESEYQSALLLTPTQYDEVYSLSRKFLAAHVGNIAKTTSENELKKCSGTPAARGAVVYKLFCMFCL